MSRTKSNRYGQTTGQNNLSIIRVFWPKSQLVFICAQKPNLFAAQTSTALHHFSKEHTIVSLGIKLNNAVCSCSHSWMNPTVPYDYCGSICFLVYFVLPLVLFTQEFKPVFCFLDLFQLLTHWLWTNVEAVMCSLDRKRGYFGHSQSWGCTEVKVYDH